MYEIIYSYDDNYQDSINKVKSNFEQVKEYCAGGLEKLKEEIDLDKMMVREEIFLTFDKKYKELDLEKNKLISDIKKVENIPHVFNGISAAADKVYNDLKNYLEAMLNSLIY